jgi:hypothetical protein
VLSYLPQGNLATEKEPYSKLNSGRGAQKLFFNCGGQGCCKISNDNQEKEVITKNQTVICLYLTMIKLSYTYYWEREIDKFFTLTLTLSLEEEGINKKSILINFSL